MFDINASVLLAMSMPAAYAATYTDKWKIA
jgi:hypothetical protein